MGGPAPDAVLKRISRQGRGISPQEEQRPGRTAPLLARVGIRVSRTRISHHAQAGLRIGVILPRTYKPVLIIAAPCTRPSNHCPQKSDEKSGLNLFTSSCNLLLLCLIMYAIYPFIELDKYNNHDRLVGKLRERGLKRKARDLYDAAAPASTGGKRGACEFRRRHADRQPRVVHNSLPSPAAQQPAAEA
jgi:hypothetical protein